MRFFFGKTFICAVLNQGIARIHQNLCQKGIPWHKLDSRKKFLPQFNDIALKTSSFLVTQFLSLSENLSLINNVS